MKISDWEGGSGNFSDLMFVKFEYDQGIDCHWSKGVIGLKGMRILIKKLGQVALGDRWDGYLRVIGDCLYIGQDKGKFVGIERGGDFSNYTTNREIKIELGR